MVGFALTTVKGKLNVFANQDTMVINVNVSITTTHNVIIHKIRAKHNNTND